MSEIRTDQPVADDTEGHKAHRLDGGEDVELGTDDTEGHKAHRFDASDDGEDDTEGHKAHR